jgi:hypothetical protein
MDAAAPALAAWLAAAAAFHAGLEALQKEDYPAAATALETARRAAPEVGLSDMAEWARLFEAEARLNRGGDDAAAGRALLRAAYAEARTPAPRARAVVLWMKHGGAPKELLPETDLKTRLDTLAAAARAGQDAQAEAILGPPLRQLIQQLSVGLPHLMRENMSMLTMIFRDEDMNLSPAGPPDPVTGTAVVLFGDHNVRLRVQAWVGPEGWVLDHLLPHGGVHPAARPEMPPQENAEPVPLPEPTPEQRAEIAGLIARLGDRDAAARADARARLTAIGRPALSALREAARADDPEIAESARELAARILATP